MKHTNGFKLNGNTGWVSLAIFLVVQTSSAMYWAGAISKDVSNLHEQILIVASTTKDAALEVKEIRIRDLLAVQKEITELRVELQSKIYKKNF